MGTIINLWMERMKVISVGIDISKGKSTVCIMKPYGEVIRTSYEIKHIEKDLFDGSY